MKKTIFKLTIVLSIFISQLSFSKVVEVYFSPDGGCEQAVVEQISQAKKSIDIAIYSFTSSKIVWELVRAKERGVAIRVYMDKIQGNGKYSKSRFLMKRGFEVKIKPNTGLQHHKFAVIDSDQSLVTGSFNWTAGAEEKNNENLMIIKDKPVIKIFKKEFEKIWASAIVYDFPEKKNKRNKKNNNEEKES